MHNGQVVCPLSYYGTLILQMLVKNRGVHEQKREYVFSHVLPHVSKSGTMLELAAIGLLLNVVSSNTLRIVSHSW